jgi:hypothetical protein
VSCSAGRGDHPVQRHGHRDQGANTGHGPATAGLDRLTQAAGTRIDLAIHAATAELTGA